MHESEKWKWSCSVVSDSLWPHWLQSTRLLHPWDFLGKSTGVACHCLLLKVGISKWKSLSRVWLFMIPWTVAYQAPLSMEFSRKEYWSGLPFLSPGDLPDPGIEPRSPVLQADSLQSEPPGSPFFFLLPFLKYQVVPKVLTSAIVLTASHTLCESYHAPFGTNCCMIGNNSSGLYIPADFYPDS